MVTARRDIQAVIFDLDGTAVPVGREGRPSPALKRIITQVQSRLHLCAATGRSWRLAESVLTEMGLTSPCIITNGTQIVDPQARTVLWQATLSEQSQRLIAEAATTHAIALACAHGFDDELYENPRGFSPRSGINTLYLLGIAHDIAPILREQLSRDPGITVSPTKSWRLPTTGVDFHITPKAATKEHAVRELATLIGVPASHMAGVGDDHNDLHLFNAVGRKVAMGNAVPELKAAADEVIGSVDEDGLAHYLSSLL